MTFEGHFGKRGLSTAGKLYYEQPDKMQLDIPATRKTVAMHFMLNGATTRVEPTQTNLALSQMAFDGLTAVSQFLSGQLTSSLKTSMDSKTGIRVQFTKPNPSGGKDEIDVVTYDFVEGLWLPTTILVHNATTGWEADLRFAGWAIGQPSTTPSVK